MLGLVQAVCFLNSTGAFVAGARMFNSLTLLLFCLFYSAGDILQIYFLIRQHSCTIIIHEQNSHTSCVKCLLITSLHVLLALVSLRYSLLCASCKLHGAGVCTVHSTARPRFHRGVWTCSYVSKGTLSCEQLE